MKRLVAVLIVLAATSGVARAVTVTAVPDPLVAGSNVTITYDGTGGPLAGQAVVYLHYGFNGWHPTATDALMSTAGEIHSVTVAVPTQATEMNLAFLNDAATPVWDNNGGANWTFTVTGGVPNAGVTTVPSPVQAGANVTVSYDPAGGPLAGATTVYLHHGVNNWNPTLPDVAMTWNAGTSRWEATVVSVKTYAAEFDVAFLDNSPTPIWDTNDGFDWRFAVTGTMPGVEVNPNPPVAGQNVTVRYNPQDTPLAAAAQVYLHYGINSWNPTYTDVAMTSITGASGPLWEATVPLSIRGCVLDIVFNDGGSIWDNNGGSDWHYNADGCVPLQSEADQLYVAKILDPDPAFDMLVVGVPGNLENNGSAMVIFINTPNATGQTELQAGGVATPPNLLPLASRRIDVLSCGTVGTGTMLPGEADYALYVNYSGSSVYLNEYYLSGSPVSSLTCCDGSSLDVFASQLSVGSTLVNDGDNVVSDPSGHGYQGGFNDTNVNTVPSQVTTGLEVAIPMYYIANGLGRNDAIDIYVAVMPNNAGVQGQFSNQTLPPSDDAAGYCSPPAMYPLRADMQPYTSVRTFNVSTLPVFGGIADGTIVPADYAGFTPEVQTCAAADPVADTSVTIVPTTATQGQPVKVWYVSQDRPLAGSPQIDLNYGFDGGALSNTVAMVATNGLTGTEWVATVTMGASALQFDLNFDNNTLTDNNNGQNWHFDVNRAATGVTASIAPDPAEAGQPVTITYDPTGRPLAGASSVTVHYGFNNWQGVTDAVMTRTVDCKWQVTITVAAFAAGAQGLNTTFWDGASTWDGQNYDFNVHNAAGTPPWTMDGYLDSCATLIGTSSSGTRHLYAGLRSGYLYVATERSQAGNDHFIFVAATPGAMQGSPWAKGGLTAAWDAYLAQEHSNGWTGWFDLNATTNRSTNAQNTTLPYMEGQIDLAAELGAIPANINLAMGAWVDPNGGALQPALQVLPGNGDANLDAAEYKLQAVTGIQVSTFDAADFDQDCDVDLTDYVKFQACLNGPNLPPAGACTVDADFDNDGNVDVKDFAAFQAAFGQ
jgi:hypothetical protein